MLSPARFPASTAPSHGCIAVGTPYGSCSFVATEGVVTLIGAAANVAVHDQYGYYPIQGAFAGAAVFYYFRIRW